MTFHRCVSSIFCDDVRVEQGNKLSFMGVYQGQMLVSQMPMVLPKLCIVLNARTPVDEPFQELIFRVIREDETLAELMFDLASMEVRKTEIGDSLENNHKFLGVTGIITLSPFVIEEPSILRIRVITEAEELKGPGLAIERAPVDSMPDTI